jgi:hypothetical protein
MPAFEFSPGCRLPAKNALENDEVRIVVDVMSRVNSTGESRASVYAFATKCDLQLMKTTGKRPRIELVTQ